jgi:hypothetical protein
VKGEIQVDRDLRDNTNTEVTSLISEAAKPAAVIDGFRHHQFVHFACHGTLEAGKPLEAGFELYGDERLTLLEIVRSHLPTSEFAHLYTAEVTERSIVDEVLHPAAAVQYCGFRSVVGTMWATARLDEDGRDPVVHFLYYLETRSMDTVSRKIRESTPVRGEEAAEEETDHPGAMGKFHSLWRMTPRVICE